MKTKHPTLTEDRLAAVAKAFDVSAEVRYWEDASVNGVEDAQGDLVPGRVGDMWQVRIDLAEGRILDWPEGTTASIHYKVCDQGFYWLVGSDGVRIAKWAGHYVPDDFLCHGDSGYGDYIILNVGTDGRIAGYERPWINRSQWRALASSSVGEDGRG